MTRSISTNNSKTREGATGRDGFETRGSVARDGKTGRIKQRAAMIGSADSASARLLKELRIESGLSVRAIAERLA